MANQPMSNLRSLEGRQVSIALMDGSRLDDCSLVSIGRNRLDNLWVFVNGEDVFVPRSHIVDIWESSSHRPWAA
jgi:hypothetical protein